MLYLLGKLTFVILKGPKKGENFNDKFLLFTSSFTEIKSKVAVHSDFILKFLSYIKSIK